MRPCNRGKHAGIAAMLNFHFDTVFSFVQSSIGGLALYNPRSNKAGQTAPALKQAGLLLAHLSLNFTQPPFERLFCF